MMTKHNFLHVSLSNWGTEFDDDDNGDEQVDIE